MLVVYRLAPRYVAVMAWWPRPRADTTRLAWAPIPPAMRSPVPSSVVPTKKVTLPVGVPPMLPTEHGGGLGDTCGEVALGPRPHVTPGPLCHLK